MAYTNKEKETIINTVCEYIEDGLSLRQSSIKANIAPKVFYQWIDEDDSKSKQYARAIELRTELLADELIEIADEQNVDTYKDDQGNTITDGTAIQRSKLKVDTRKWLMSKMFPRKYGDKITQDINIVAEQPLFSKD